MSDAALAHYDALMAKVDAFFARVQQRHGADMSCASGCSDCCHADLSVTQVEATAIARHVDGLDDEAKVVLGQWARAGAHAGGGPRCVALDEGGRCGIYSARPLVCRSHGLPIRLETDAPGENEPPARKRLPVIETCFRNFTAGGPQNADADCVLDQRTLSMTLLAVDAAFAQAGGGAHVPGSRRGLDAVLIELCTPP